MVDNEYSRRNALAQQLFMSTQSKTLTHLFSALDRHKWIHCPRSRICPLEVQLFRLRRARSAASTTIRVKSGGCPILRIHLR